MTRWLAILAALCLCSCASTRIAPRFDKPSTRPIAKAHKSAISHIRAAKDKVKAIDKVIDANPKDLVLFQLKLQVQDLTWDLDNALSDLNKSDGSLRQLDTQLAQQTTKANNLSDSYDKAGVEINSLKTSRHRWVTYALYAAGLALLEGAWIFRKPLMFLIGGIGGV